MILASACLHVIRRIHPAATVYWIGRAPSLSLIADSFPEMIPVKISRRSSLRQDYHTIIRSIPHADHLLDLQCNGPSFILSWALKFRLGCQVSTFNKRSLRRSWQVAKARFTGRRGRHEAKPSHQGYLFQRMVKHCELMFGFKGQNSTRHGPRPHLIRSGQPKFSYDLAIGVGARHATKSLPLDLLKAVIQRVFHQSGAPFRLLLLGDQSDVARAEELASQLDSAMDIYNPVGRTSLPETRDLLLEAKVCLSSDSAVGHLSEAVGCPVVVVYGPTSESFGYRPFLKQSESISSPLGCRPCSKDGAKPCRYQDRQCFSDIDPATVATALLKRIQAKGVEKPCP